LLSRSFFILILSLVALDCKSPQESATLEKPTTVLMGPIPVVNSLMPKSIGKTFREFSQRIGGALKYDENLFSGYFTAADEYATSIFPVGRSLERKISNRENPRIIVQIRYAPSFEEHVHIAFTPRNNQLQIIASNPSGRGNGGYNDFIIVDNFAPGQTPVISSPPAGVCTACHQSGSLIFSTFPWSEELHDYYAQDPSGFDRPPHPAAIIASKCNLTVADLHPVLRTNVIRFVHRQKIRNICPKNAACRIEIAKAALSKNYDISVVNRLLAGETEKWLYDIAEDELSSGPDASESSVGELVFPFEAKEDPLFPRYRLPGDLRPLTLSLGEIIEYAIAEDVEKNPQAILDDTQINKLLALSSVQYFISTHWPLQRSEVNHLFLSYLQDPNLNKLPKGQQEVEVAESQRSPRDIFLIYCSSCHLTPGGPAPGIDFDQAKAYVGTVNPGRTALNLIKRKLMPPPDALQMTENERRVILEYLQ
jgi:hypothetical protein